MQRKFDKKLFKNSVINNVKNLFRKTIDEATPMQMFQAVSYAVKDIIIDEWIATHKEYEKQDAKTVYYLSMEFLMGRALGNNIINIGAREEIE
ncbi:MAG: glycogen phosphorylase, partial [Frisingicoccus sp.]|nr:glycogen phosphorylase [Frisingicoccus sp.]